MIPEYFEVNTDAKTGEKTIRPYTEEEIAALAKPPPPASVTPRQVRLLLLQKGLLPQVETLVSQSGEAAKITWEFALEFRRNDALLLQLAAALGLTEEQLDNFFIEAASI